MKDLKSHFDELDEWHKLVHCCSSYKGWVCAFYSNDKIIFQKCYSGANTTYLEYSNKEKVLGWKNSIWPVIRADIDKNEGKICDVVALLPTDIIDYEG